MSNKTYIKKIFLILAFTLFGQSVFATSIDSALKTVMKAYRVPVVGYAIIDNYKVISSRTLSINPKHNVSSKSLFQAASISKSMAAYAALTLVNAGRLRLDSPANHYLDHWKIPKNSFNKKSPVRIQQLMDMTSGLSVSGFAGYPRGKALPSPIALLNGAVPANNAPVRVFYKPGSRYFYSGGAFQVLQQVVADITKQPFETFMNKSILTKMGMKDSIYQYPLTDKLFLRRAVPGYAGWSGEVITGGWHNYACAGAGGMWSTPRDLATFGLNITKAYLGRPGGLISKGLAKRMLTRRSHTSYGLGFVVSGKGNHRYFWKAGHNLGYHSLLIVFPDQGKGLAIMTNSETGGIVIDYIVALIARKYHWPYYFPFFDELIATPDY